MEWKVELFERLGGETSLYGLPSAPSCLRVLSSHLLWQERLYSCLIRGTVPAGLFVRDQEHNTTHYLRILQ